MENSQNRSLVGSTVAGVLIQDLLGKGSMAEVYLGYHQELERPVALKILLDSVREDPVQMQLLQQEAQVLVAMKHPNIVQCVDCNMYQGRPYLIMELLEGISLQDRLNYLRDQGLLPALQIVDLVAQSAASAIDYAHSQGVIHRDIKPANMMLLGSFSELTPDVPIPPDVRVVLTDFGVASLLEATDNPNMVVGTPSYMSPEQASGGSPDLRSDIYSLGVVIYELLVGDVPFQWPVEQGEKARQRYLELMKRGMPNTAGEIQQVVYTALMDQPGSRYPRAGLFARSLSRTILR